MAYGVNSDPQNLMFVGDADSWGGPNDGVDLEASAGIGVGGSSWHTRMTINLWQFILIIGALALLWALGGVVFRRINIV